jgi:hypothetical protein
VAGCKVRDQNGASKSYFIAIVQNAIYLCRRELRVWPIAVLEIELAAGFDFGNVCVHHHVLGAGHLFNQSTAGGVVKMRVTDEKNFYIAEVKAQLLDIVSNHRNSAFEIAVDEDVSIWGCDQKRRQTPCPHVIDVAGDVVRGEGFGPVEGVGCGSGRSETQAQHEQKKG